MTIDDDIKRVEGKIDDLQSSLDRLARNIESLGEAIESLNQKLPSSSYGLRGMDTEISGAKEVSSMKFSNIAKQLQKSVAQLNESAKEVGEHAFGISDLDAEIKGGIQMVDDDLHLSQLPQDAIKPESVSTIRFSLRPIPVIKLVDDKDK
ncbi:MAG TPA: hypothetical protein PLZ42_01860 [Methanothrix sp.]|nr:hypothetical protein [Methanothrix sp.]